jgi:hypothetical protein
LYPLVADFSSFSRRPTNQQLQSVSESVALEEISDRWIFPDANMLRQAARRTGLTLS